MCWPRRCAQPISISKFWMCNKPNEFDIIWPALCSSPSLTASESICRQHTPQHYYTRITSHCVRLILFFLCTRTGRSAPRAQSGEEFSNWHCCSMCCTFFRCCDHFPASKFARPFDLHSNSNSVFRIHVNNVTSCSLTVYTAFRIPILHLHLHCIIM